jgi:hypothetical protein
MRLKRSGRWPTTFNVNQSLDNFDLKNIKEFDPLDEGSDDEKRATSPPK